MESETWFEVFITYKDESTETIHNCDTEQEAKDYLNENPSLKLDYDEWRLAEDGTNKRV